MAKRLGQIDMFTKRVRNAAKPPLERQLHIAVADTLRWGISPGWIWWHVPNGELRTDATGALLQRMGVKVGVSDIHLLNSFGALFALELKRKGKKPTDEQKAFLAHVALGRGGSGWADNYDDAIAILRGWGALMERLHTL